MSSWTKGIRGKLLIMIAIPTAVVGGLIWTADRSLYSLEHSLKDAVNVNQQFVEHSGEMDSAINGIIRYLWTAYTADLTNAEERSRYIQSSKDQAKRFEFNRDEFLRTVQDSRSQEQFKPAAESWAKFHVIFKEVIRHFEAGTQNDNEAARTRISTQLRPNAAIISKALGEMRKARIEEIEKDAAGDVADAERSIWMIRILGIAGTLATAFFGLLIAWRLSRQLASITESIGMSGEQVLQGATQLSGAAQQVSNGATESASSLEETVSSIEELSSMVQLNAKNAKQASSLSQTSSEAATQGEREIRNLIESMKEISQSSKKIEEIINVIDDIAFQTNLLALNAAVEAARAGEQGKGFAVVAEAVRGLAQRSASAAKDITALIQDSVSKIDRGSKIVDNSGNALKTIVTSVKKVSDLNNEIATASAEQANGISQISKAMNALDTSTQQNAAASEEVAATSEEMSSQADSLRELVAQLSLIVNGGLSVTPSRAQKHPQVTQPAKSTKSATSAPAPSAALEPAPGRPKLEVHEGGKSASAPKSSSKAEELIPFDMDESGDTGKVGTTDGF